MSDPALDQGEGAVYGFGAGSVEYLPKLFRRKELLARVQAHLKLHRSVIVSMWPGKTREPNVWAL